MSVKEQLNQDLKVALKARDSVRVSTLRRILSELKNKEISTKHQASDEDVFMVMRNIAKKHRDSIDQFTSGARSDLVAKEQAELQIVQSYLPAFLSDHEIGVLLDNAIQESGAKSPSDFGMLMKFLKPKISGRADGAKLATMVKEKLNTQT